MEGREWEIMGWEGSGRGDGGRGDGERGVEGWEESEWIRE